MTKTSLEEQKILSPSEDFSSLARRFNDLNSTAKMLLGLQQRERVPFIPISDLMDERWSRISGEAFAPVKASTKREDYKFKGVAYDEARQEQEQKEENIPNFFFPIQTPEATDAIEGLKDYEVSSYAPASRSVNSRLKNKAVKIDLPSYSGSEEATEITEVDNIENDFDELRAQQLRSLNKEELDEDGYEKFYPQSTFIRSTLPRKSSFFRSKILPLALLSGLLFGGYTAWDHFKGQNSDNSQSKDFQQQKKDDLSLNGDLDQLSSFDEDGNPVNPEKLSSNPVPTTDTLGDKITTDANKLNEAKKLDKGTVEKTLTKKTVSSNKSAVNKNKSSFYRPNFESSYISPSEARKTKRPIKLSSAKRVYSTSTNYSSSNSSFNSDSSLDIVPDVDPSTKYISGLNKRIDPSVFTAAAFPIELSYVGQGDLKAAELSSDAYQASASLPSSLPSVSPEIPSELKIRENAATASNIEATTSKAESASLVATTVTTVEKNTEKALDKSFNQIENELDGIYNDIENTSLTTKTEKQAETVGEPVISKEELKDRMEKPKMAPAILEMPPVLSSPAPVVTAPSQVIGQEQKPKEQEFKIDYNTHNAGSGDKDAKENESGHFASPYSNPYREFKTVTF